MPCKDTTAEITVHLDKNDCLIDFTFSKISCFCLESDEDQFLLHMELEALHAAIAQLLGISIDNERYQIASISYDESGTTINQMMSPLREMPKIVSCIKRGKNPSKQTSLDKV
jgi:hypothetical protein